MTTATETGYAVFFSNGHIRLYNTKDESSSDEDKRWIKRNIFIEGGASVNSALHYRGRIPKTGIAFGRTDQSFGQMLAAIHNA
jgi:hypothetical protein